MKIRNYWNTEMCLQTEKDISTHTFPDTQLQANFQLNALQNTHKIRKRC